MSLSFHSNKECLYLQVYEHYKNLIMERRIPAGRPRLRRPGEVRRGGRGDADSAGARHVSGGTRHAPRALRHGSQRWWPG